MIIRILIIAIVALFLVMWVRAVIDVWRRTDLSSSAKAAWAIIGPDRARPESLRHGAGHLPAQLLPR